MTELLSSQGAHCGPVKVLNKAHSSSSTESGLPLAHPHTPFAATEPRRIVRTDQSRMEMLRLNDFLMIMIFHHTICRIVSVLTQCLRVTASASQTLSHSKEECRAGQSGQRNARKVWSHFL
ncbi:uncharacterized, partial [Tachysurus ichikawai]